MTHSGTVSSHFATWGSTFLSMTGVSILVRRGWLDMAGVTGYGMIWLVYSGTFGKQLGGASSRAIGCLVG